MEDIDPVSSLNRQFVFNGDNKQIQVKDLDSSGQSIGTYFYDGEGKRVKKVTDQETTVFVYSSGKLIAEYSTQLSLHPAISYTTTDHVGSPASSPTNSARSDHARTSCPLAKTSSPASTTAPARPA